MALSEGLDDLDKLDVLLHKQRVWMGINITFVHTVSTDSVVMLRRRGTPGQHEDKMIQKFISDDSAAHLRLNLHQERAAVRTTTKARGLITVDDSDSDIEVIKEPKVSRKRDYRADGSPPLRRQRRRLSVLSVDSPVATMDDSPQPSTISLVSPTSSFPSTPSPSPAVLDLSKSPPPWPHGMFVVDVVGGMLKMDTLSGNRAMRFGQAFSRAEYKPSTYDDQVRKWRGASATLKQSAPDAERSSGGLWSTFARRAAQEARDVA
ncbi:hypothetical protein B0H17DRAFT_1200108 [Mycena rosella]|uniref:Uncharacterized protein n=1 Tax=Mycena rosella TaxID=1033263 RepID=A0AAD7GFY0_MYCRO|nr:hypothetical protein B0H17DRAFT_1200108 [Mycena rosella]